MVAQDFTVKTKELTLHSYASAVGAKIAFTIEPEGDDQ